MVEPVRNKGGAPQQPPQVQSGKLGNHTVTAGGEPLGININVTAPSPKASQIMGDTSIDSLGGSGKTDLFGRFFFWGR